MERKKREKKDDGKGKRQSGAHKKMPDASLIQTASPAPKKRITIADIARQAGVSPATVSITLADRRDIVISEATRAHVKRCAEAIGYLPSRLGEGFLRGRSRLIGVLVLADSYLPFLDCIAGIQMELARADYVPLIISSDWLTGYGQNSLISGGECLNKLPGLRRLLEYQVEGVIYFSMDAAHAAACIEELTRLKIPAVVLGGVEPQAETVDIVSGDNEAIGQMVADHLLSSGCTSFAFGMPAFSHPIDEAVRFSFASRLKAAGYACRDFTVNEENSSDLGPLLSRLVEPPAGLFCSNGNIAALAMRAAFSLGWVMPRDFAVVGMCHPEISELNAVPMTTVDRKSFAVGETAVKQLIQRIEGFAGQPQRILIPPSLNICSSSRSDVSSRIHSLLPA